MEDQVPDSWTVFDGIHRVLTGPLNEAALAAKAAFDEGSTEAIMILDDRNCQRFDIDLRATVEDILRRLPAQEEPAQLDAPRGRGRPKLGVIAREVTLLPRHWEWLNHQPGGASVALRKLVEEARHTHRFRDRVRRAQETAYRFMSIMAGDRKGFEEATRALFARNHVRFDAVTGGWPIDIRDHAQRLAADAFATEAESPIAPGRGTP